MIVEERLTTYIDSLNWQIPAGLKEVEKEALADGVPIIRRSMQSLLGFCFGQGNRMLYLKLVQQSVFLLC